MLSATVSNLLSAGSSLRRLSSLCQWTTTHPEGKETKKRFYKYRAYKLVKWNTQDKSHWERSIQPIILHVVSIQ